MPRRSPQEATVESRLPAPWSDSPVPASTMHGDPKCFNMILRNSGLSALEEQQNDREAVGENFFTNVGSVS